MRKYNLSPDVPDQRDLLFKSVKRLKASTLPKSFSLTRNMSPIEDQGDVGSCTAQAFAGNLEYLYQLKKDKFQASRLFIYYNERVLIRTINEDSGAHLRDGIKTLAKQGVCSEESWPYREELFTVKPPLTVYDDALKRKITQYLRVTTHTEMKQCIAAGFPFVFGLPIYESFESPNVEYTGTVPNPKSSESMLGGHAMLVVGYSDSLKRFTVRNSWGKSWGKNGYCTIPYSYLEQAFDCWTVRA